MEKITEKILLEKGSPKTNKLDQIKTLNLSRMGLKSEDLPVPLLSKLHRLEQLDLSWNTLQEFPKGLHLPSLKMLDCSNNDMEDVMSLESLSNVEELRLEDNFYLTVNDQHKVIFLLPKLRIFNGKDITPSAHHIRHGSTEILRNRVIGVWERSYSLPNPVTPSGLVALEKSFVKAACSQVKYGPSSLSDYTKWRVEMIAKDYLQSLTCSEEDSVATPTKVNEANVERKTHDLGANNTTSPQKRTGNSADTTAEASPRKSSRLLPAAPSPRKSTRLLSSPQKTETRLSSPRKHARATSEVPLEGSPRKSSRLENIPQKGASKNESPRKGAKSPAVSSPMLRVAKCESPRKTTKDQPTIPKMKQTAAKTENSTSRKTAMFKLQVPQEPVSLQPLHVLQCHSRQDSPEDFDTQLWACAFEPSQYSSSDLSSQTVATCGGETLCVIDCESGHVLKKYKVPGEEFFSLAWTTVLMSRTGGSARPCNILAAGGKRGIVKLIHPRVNLAFGEFRASRRAISIVRFSPHNASFLFTGTYENKIIMWDIGELDRDYNIKISKLIVLETGSTPLHLSLPPTSPDTQLLSACDDGLYSFDIQLSKNTQKRNEEMEIVFPIYKKNDTKNNYRTIDGLSFLSDDIVASKSHMQGSIYLWSWSATRASLIGKKKEVPAVILAELQWSSTDIPYLSLGTCPGYGYVVCGDEKGNLWVYHITNTMMEHFKSGKMISATEVLEWPSPVRAGKGPVEGPTINSVAMDPDLRYLVALTDKNMSVVWRRAVENKETRKDV